MTYVKLMGGDGPLCPNIGNEAHVLRNQILDAFYNSAEKDADGEMTPAFDKAYYNAAYERISDSMNLYTESVTAYWESAKPVRVEAWWFKCPTCGFVLPATVREAI